MLGPDVKLIIPPQRNAVTGHRPQRKAHIEMNADKGRIAWQKATGYGQRSRGELQIGQFKQVIGPQLKSCKTETQTTQTMRGVTLMNRTTALGPVDFERGT